MPIGSGLSGQLGVSEEAYVNNVQTITGTPSATFGLNFDGALTTITLTTSATAASIQNALNALPNIGASGVSCSGGVLPAQVVVTFGGNPLTSKRNLPLLTVQGVVTGLTIANQTVGTGYGDYVPPATFNEFTDENVLLDVQHIDSAALRGGTAPNQTLRSDRTYVNVKGAVGDVDMEFASKAMGKWLKHMQGPSAFTITTPTNGVLTRLFRSQLGDPSQTSLGVQIGRTDTGGSGGPGTTRAFSYRGGKITGWELNNALDGLLTVKLNMDFQQEDLTQTLGTASYASAFELLHFGEGQITIAGANFDVRSFNLKAVMGLKTDRYFLRNNTFKKEPIRNAMVVYTGDIEAEFTDLSAYQRFVSGTPATVTATWRGSQIEAVASPGPYFNQLQVTLPSVQFTGATPDIQGADVIVQSLPFRVLYDGTALSPVTIDWYTTDTTV